MKSNGVKSLKLYELGIGCVMPDFEGNPTDCFNWSRANILAHDAQEAIRKYRLRKGEYIASVQFIHDAE